MPIEIKIPRPGITVTEVTLSQWTAEEGQEVEKDQLILAYEAEKVSYELPSPEAGLLHRLVASGRTVAVETAVGLLAADRAEWQGFQSETPEAVKEASSEAGAPRPQRPAPPARAVPSGDGWVKASPWARRLAAEKGVDLAKVSGTGPGGRIKGSDVEAFASVVSPPLRRVTTLARRLAEREGVDLSGVEGSGVRGKIVRADVQARIEAGRIQGPALGDVLPMSNVRKIIARRMSESAFTAPHIYFFTEVCLDPLFKFREAILSEGERLYGLRLSINDFLIKAVALNILDFPLLNAEIRGEELYINPEINIGLAVAQPEGLIVPAVESAHLCGLAEIARQRLDLIERARTGKLTLPEIERGTFTVSSLAQYDITHFTAILNPPQSGILSVGKTEEKLFLENNEVKAKKTASFGLSVDHRIIDGAYAAGFLQGLKKKLENPVLTFLHV